MKHTHSILSIVSVIALSACHDNSSSPLKPLDSGTFNDKSGLDLFYNGTRMPGKTASIIVNGDKATLKIYSTIDISEMEGQEMKGDIPGPGPVPGTPQLDLCVNLSPAGQAWEFSGDSDTEFCSFSYSGYASTGNLSICLDNVSLKNPALKTTVWQPAPIVKGSDGTYKSLPIFIDWKYDISPDTDINLSPLLDLLATLPVIPVYGNSEYMSISEALCETIKSIAFSKDGNITVSYITSAFGALQHAQTLPNTLQYVIDSSDFMRLFPDPMSALGLWLVNTSGGTPADEIDLTDKGLFPISDSNGSPTPHHTLVSAFKDKILKSVIKYLSPKLATGFPLRYIHDGNTLDIFIDGEMASEMFESIVIPVIKDETILKSIELIAASDPAMSEILPELRKAIAAIPYIIEKTTSFNIGVSLIPAISL